MTTPRSLGDKPVRSLVELLQFVNQIWLPDYRVLRRKLGAMLSQPGVFAVPVWDGQSWHSAQMGTLGADLPDADAGVDVADGTHRIAREGTLTGDHTYSFFGAGFYDALVVWNMTTAHTLTLTLGAGAMVLPPKYVGFLHYDPATVAWEGDRRLPLALDPELFG